MFLQNWPQCRIAVFLLFAAAGLFAAAENSDAKEPITIGETDPVMLDLDPLLIDLLCDEQSPGASGQLSRTGSMADLIVEPKFLELVNKHDLKLFSGPMIGDVRSDSAKFWLRTAGAAEIQVRIGRRVSRTVRTSADDDFTAVVRIGELEPFTDYNYQVVVDGTVIERPSFRFRTAPERGQRVRFHVAFGSGSRYVPVNERAWTAMRLSRPLAYLGLGDNVYIDSPDRNGTQRLFYYRRCLSPAYRSLIAGVGMYAIWDDHDMADNDSSGGSGMSKSWKRSNWRVFRENWNNPSYGGGESVPGTWHKFTLGDVEFFMTDGRFYRDKKRRTMLGPDQKKWLLESLGASRARFKVIASGTLWTDDADKAGKDSWAGRWARGERDEIFDFINRRRIDGVVLISGDRHRTDIWKIPRPEGAYPLYEFVTAKVTNEHTHETRKEAVWSYNRGNFWGELEFDLTPRDPIMTFRCVDIGGTTVKTFPLALSQLRHVTEDGEGSDAPASR